MKIRKLEENNKQIDLILQQIEDNKKLIDKITSEIKSDNVDTIDSVSELIKKLNDAKVTIKSLNVKIKLLKNEFSNIMGVVFNREMIGNEVAKLMTEIMDKNYVYREDYSYKIDDGSHNRWEYRHVDILRKKIYIVIDEKAINHEPFVECYDDETINLSGENHDKYWHHKQGYVNTYKDMIDSNLLFMLPVPIFNYNGQKDYIKQGNMEYKIDTNNGDLFIYGLYERNKIIDDFLSIIILKSFYTNKSLSQEEIEKIRIKFIELYKSGYAFEYYEDDLYNIEEKNKQKVISSNNN